MDSFVFGVDENNNAALRVSPGQGETNQKDIFTTDENGNAAIRVIGAGGGGGVTSVNGKTGAVTVSEVPSQSGQSGKFLTTNGTSASWATVSGDLPSQTGNSGKFLTTDGTDASWSDKPLVNNNPRNTTSIMIGNIGSTIDSIGVGSVCLTSNNTYSGWVGLGGYSVAIGTQSCGGSYSVAIGSSCSCARNYSTAIGYSATSVGSTSANHNIALGAYANAGASGMNTVHAIQIGSTGSTTTNSDSNTFKVGNQNGNFEMMSADGTIPAARHASLPASDGTYVLKCVISGGVPTLSWVAE